MRVMNDNIFDLLGPLREKCEIYDQYLMKKYKLNESEYSFFISLKKCDCINSCIMAKGMGISLSRISRVIDNLVKKNLLERTIDENDRRSIKLTLTNSGVLLSKKLNKERSKNEALLIKKTGLAEFTTLKQSVQKLSDLLSQINQ